MDVLLRDLYKVGYFIIIKVIPKEFLTVFTPQEFEMLLNGLPFISVEDWEYHTIYKGAYTKNHSLIQ